MLKKYKMISIIYGGSGNKYAEQLNEMIQKQANENRFPLEAKIVMDSVLTGDLLECVTELFASSEFCVAFLTADDCCTREGGAIYRLRQNVVFELGMAIFRLGRNRCILLSDFNPTAASVELPSDLKGVEIKYFTPENQDYVFKNVLNKILQLSRTSVYSKEVEEVIPQYDHLLERSDYYVDYEHLFSAYNHLPDLEGNVFLKHILEEWAMECNYFSHYEERCMYFFERIGFIPIFGRQEWVIDWCITSQKMLSKYNKNDIAYCGIKKLKFIQNLAYVVAEYTRLKMQTERTPCVEDYEELLLRLMFDSVETGEVSNPLVVTVYLDYLGLLYMRLFEHYKKDSFLYDAINCFSKIIDHYVDRVDMSLRIWAGFVNFNLARCYFLLYQRNRESSHAQSAQEYFSKATLARKNWLVVSDFNFTIRSALSYEYFICRIKQIEASKYINSKSVEEIHQAYKALELELEFYMQNNQQLERLRFVQQILKEHQEEI